MEATNNTFQLTRKARGKRIMAIRQALRFSRRALAEKYSALGLKASTLQSWEDGRFGGLSESGASALCQAFQAEGVHCTQEWLFFGIGQNPLDADFSIPVTQNTKAPEKKPHSAHHAIAEELRLFHQHHTDSVDAIVTDTALAPFLLPGDFVAGCRYFENNFEQGLELPCIVQTPQGQTLIRILKQSAQQGLYDLYGANALLESQMAVFSIAPVLWVRRKKAEIAPILPKQIKKLSPC